MTEPPRNAAKLDAEAQSNAFLEYKARLLITLRRKEKQLHKSVGALQANLERCLNWPSWHHRGQLLQSVFHQLKRGLTQLAVADWEQEGKEEIVTLDPRLKPAENVAAYFARSRRLQRGIVAAQRALERQQQLLQTVRELYQRCEESQSEAELSALVPRESKPAKATCVKTGRLPYRLYYSASGLAIWVGRGAKDNHHLTFHLAKGSNWWCHVEGSSGAHVIIRTDRDQELDNETLQDALQLALQHSGRQGAAGAHLLLTQCKYLKPAGKGQPGRVFVSKAKRYDIQVDTERLRALKERRQQPPGVNLTF